MSDHTLLGLCGSLRSVSINQKLMREAARLYAPDRFVEGSLRMPLYDGDVETSDGIPAEVETLAQQILDADAIVIAAPEYNKMIPGVLKNGLDWISRVKGNPWLNKPVAIMSATAGRTGGDVAMYTLRHAMAPFRARMHMAPATQIPNAAAEFDENGRLTGERYAEALGAQMAALRAEADMLRAIGNG